MSIAIPVLIGSLLVGFGFVVGGPAMQSIVPNLIRDGELSTAMALNSMPMTIGRIVGPATGAYLAAHLGSASGFAVSAALHLVFAIFLLVVNFPSPPPNARAGTDYRVRTAIRYVWRDRPLLLALVAVATVGIASDPSITLTPSMADALGGGARLVGLLSAGFGIGAAVGMAVLAMMRGPDGLCAGVIDRVGGAWRGMRGARRSGPCPWWPWRDSCWRGLVSAGR